MTKVLVIFNHRPEKVTHILPYSGLEYNIVENIRYMRRMSLFSALKTKWLLYRHNPDIVFTQLRSGGGIYTIMLETKKAGKKFVIRLGGHIYDEFKENEAVPELNRQAMSPVYHSFYWYAFKILKAADHIVVVSEDAKKRLLEYGHSDNMVSVVPVSIDIERFAGEKIPHEGRVILTVVNTNFMPKVRAVMDYCGAVLDALRNNKDIRWRLIAPGRNRDIINALISTDRIEVLGHVDDIEREYRSADILAYFSYLDTIPNIVLESWASRIPVVANRCEWSEEIIKNGETGLIAGSPEEAADHIRTLLGGEIGDILIKNAYQYLSSYHSNRVAGERLGEVFRGIVK